MAASSTVVIKVRYGDMLRRFNAQIVDDKFALNFDGLQKKIHFLFNFAPETELMLTYTDEDSDIVALVDDDDLHDVVKQRLNPLRITVKLNGEKSPNIDSSSSSTPLRSPLVQQPLPGVSEILSKVPEPLRGTLVKLSADVASKASSSSSPVISELVDVFSKVGLSFLGNSSEPKTGERSGVLPEMKTKNEGRSVNSTGESKKASSFDFNAVATALEKQDENVPNLPPENPELGFLSHAIRRKEKLNKKHIPSVFDKCYTEKGVCNDKTRSGGKSIWGPPLGASNFGGPIKRYGCPSSGTEKITNIPLFPATGLFRRNFSQYNAIGDAIHRGVCCDGCGDHPIIGPRFKSKVKLGYDLCDICFVDTRNKNDYIRMDHPADVPQNACVKGLHDWARYQSAPHVIRGPKCELGVIKLDSRFIQDVNIFDGTVMLPSTPFTKIWRMRNNGILTWPPKAQLVWIGGDKLSHSLSVELQIPPGGLRVDQEFDISVDFISPDFPGRYVSYWVMASPSGQKFGQPVWVIIQVDASLKEMPRETVRNLNLNFPPFTGPEIINVGPAPAVVNNHEIPESSRKPDTDHESKFPINNSFGASTSTVPSPASSSGSSPIIDSFGASTSTVPSAASSSGSSPIIDVSDVGPPLPSVSPAFLGPLPPPPPPPPPPPALLGEVEQSGVELPGKDQVEEKLLRELEEMGFKEVDLNKEALWMNKYDLEQAVDDLCGVAEWDPILEELQEMGFNDRETNKKLLKKNNGSIKRVVMDLVAAEQL